MNNLIRHIIPKWSEHKHANPAAVRALVKQTGVELPCNEERAGFCAAYGKQCKSSHAVNEAPAYNLLLNKAELILVKEALGLFSSICQGQFEVIYYNLATQGHLHTYTGAPMGRDDVKKLLDLLHDIKELMGYPEDGCHPSDHPCLPGDAKLSHKLEERINDVLQPTPLTK